MNKARLVRDGRLPTRVTASQQAILSAKTILGLDEEESEEESEEE
jgi:hypothetical protein